MRDYIKAIEDFTELELIKDNVKVCWWYADEGNDGYYQADDPDDVPLLRFDIATWDAEENWWVCLEDASYCTLMPIDTPKEILMRGLEKLMSVFYEDTLKGHVSKRMCEHYSWMSPEDFEDEENNEVLE